MDSEKLLIVSRQKSKRLKLAIKLRILVFVWIIFVGCSLVVIMSVFDNLYYWTNDTKNFLDSEEM